MTLAHLEPALSLQSHARSGFSPSSADLFHSESPPIIRQSTCAGSNLLAFGKARLDFAPSAMDLLRLGSFLPTRSHGQTGLHSPALDFLNLDSMASARSSVRFVFAAPIVGLSRMGSISFLSAIDKVHPELPLPLRSLSRVESASSAFDFLRLGSPSPLRSYNRCGPAPPAICATRMSSSPSVLGLVHLDSSLSLHSHAYSEPLMSTFDLLHPGLSTSMQTSCHIGPASLAFGKFSRAPAVAENLRQDGK